MIKELKFKKYINFVFILLMMIISMMVIKIPKTSALTDPIDSTFMPYFDGRFIGLVDSVGGYDGTLEETYRVLILEDIDNMGAIDKIFTFLHYFDFVNPETINVGDKVIWHGTGPTGLWEKYVEPDHVPVFNGETAFITNIDDLITIAEIMSRIKAIDNEDGDITHLIEIELDDYSWARTEIMNGTYAGNALGASFTIDLVVTDSAENTAQLAIHVFIKDITEPVITGPTQYNQSYTTKKNVGTILSALNATDNYDTSVEVKVKNDNYTANYNQIGSYDIIFNATDTSNNEALYIVTVNVIDDIAPIFSGPMTIMKGQAETLTLQSILNQITVNDVIDTNVNFVVKTDKYTGNGNKVGSWEIVLEATDLSGNVATHTITITVKDNIPPVFYVDNFFVHVDDVVNLTRQDIIDLLTASGQLQISGTTTFSFLLNEYEGNENVPGIYGVMVKSTSNDGTEKQVSLAIQVNETGEDDDDDIIIDEKKNLFTKFWDWVKSPTVEDGKFYNGYYILIGIAFLGLFIYFYKPKKYKRYRR